MSYSNFISTASPPEGQDDVLTNGVVSYTFKARSNRGRHTHMLLFHLTDGQAFTLTRSELINAHTSLEKTMDAIWTSTATVEKTIDCSDNIDLDPLYDHQRTLAGIADSSSNSLTVMRNGLSFLDECERLDIVPTVWVDSPSLQTILPFANPSQAKRTVAMCRHFLDLAYMMQHPGLYPEMHKWVDVVGYTNGLCDMYLPDPKTLNRLGAINRETRSGSRSSWTSAELIYYEAAIMGKLPADFECSTSEASSSSSYLTVDPYTSDASRPPAKAVRFASSSNSDKRPSIKPIQPREVADLIASSAGPRSLSHTGPTRETRPNLEWNRRASEGGDKPGTVANVAPCPQHSPLSTPTDIPVDSLAGLAVDNAANINKPLPKIHTRSGLSKSYDMYNHHLSLHKPTKTIQETNTAKRSLQPRTSERSHKPHASQGNPSPLKPNYNASGWAKSDVPNYNTSGWAKSDVSCSATSSTSSYHTTAQYDSTSAYEGHHSTKTHTKRTSKSKNVHHDSTSNKPIVPAKTVAPSHVAELHRISSRTSDNYTTATRSSGSSITESSFANSSILADASVPTQAKAGSRHTKLTRKLENMASNTSSVGSQTSSQSFHTARDGERLVDRILSKEGTKISLFGRRRLTRELKESLSANLPQSGSMTPNSDCSYNTAPIWAPSMRDAGTQTVDIQNELRKKVSGKLGQPAKRSPTARVAVGGNRLRTSTKGMPPPYGRSHPTIVVSDPAAMANFTKSSRTAPRPSSPHSDSSASGSSTARPPSTIGSTGSSTAYSPISPKSLCSSSVMSVITAYPPSTPSPTTVGPSPYASKAYTPNTHPSAVRSTAAYPLSTQGPKNRVRSIKSLDSRRSSVTAVPDEPWWRAPKDAAPLSDCSSSAASQITVILRKRRPSNSSTTSFTTTSTSDACPSAYTAESTLTDPCTTDYYTPASAASSDTDYTDCAPLSGHRRRGSTCSISSVSSVAAVVGRIWPHEL